MYRSPSSTQTSDEPPSARSEPEGIAFPSDLRELCRELGTEVATLLEGVRKLRRGVDPEEGIESTRHRILERVLGPRLERQRGGPTSNGQPNRTAARSFLQFSLPPLRLEPVRVAHALTSLGATPRIARTLAPYLVRDDAPVDSRVFDLAVLPFERALDERIRSIGGTWLRSGHVVEVHHDHRFSLAPELDEIVALSRLHEVAPLERIRLR